MTKRKHVKNSHNNVTICVDGIGSHIRKVDWDRVQLTRQFISRKWIRFTFSAATISITYSAI